MAVKLSVLSQPNGTEKGLVLVMLEKGPTTSEIKAEARKAGLEREYRFVVPEDCDLHIGGNVYLSKDGVHCGVYPTSLVRHEGQTYACFDPYSSVTGFSSVRKEAVCIGEVDPETAKERVRTVTPSNHGS